MIPEGITLQTLHDFTAQHLRQGLGEHKVAIDPRGLSFLGQKHYSNIQIGLPPLGETFSADKVFLRAVF